MSTLKIGFAARRGPERSADTKTPPPVLEGIRNQHLIRQIAGEDYKRISAERLARLATLVRMLEENPERYQEAKFDDGVDRIYTLRYEAGGYIHTPWTAGYKLVEEMDKILESSRAKMSPESREAYERLKENLSQQGLDREVYGGWVVEPEGSFYLRSHPAPRKDGRRTMNGALLDITA